MCNKVTKAGLYFFLLSQSRPLGEGVIKYIGISSLHTVKAFGVCLLLYLTEIDAFL